MSPNVKNRERIFLAVLLVLDSRSLSQTKGGVALSMDWISPTRQCCCLGEQFQRVNNKRTVVGWSWRIILTMRSSISIPLPRQECDVLCNSTIRNSQPAPPNGPRVVICYKQEYDFFWNDQKPSSCILTYDVLVQVELPVVLPTVSRNQSHNTIRS
jgi:hypothetical protein